MASISHVESERPARDPTIEKSVAQELTIEKIASGRSGLHPQQDVDPRPMNEQRIPEMCRDRNRALIAMSNSEKPASLHYCFYSSRIRSKATDAISVRKERLWWLAAPGDAVQLADGANAPHLTTILKVDREAERIQFIDPWPDVFFLKENRNALGVKATDDLVISKREFLRVAEGLITLDTPALPKHYYAAFPEEANDIELRLRFGLAFLTASPTAFAQEAIQYLEPAWATARHTGDREAERVAGGKLYVTLVCNGFDSQRRGDPTAAKAMDASAGRLLGLYPEREIFEPLDADDFGHMGHLAGVTRHFDDSAFYLDNAIDRKPADHMLYVYRAIALSNLSGFLPRARADLEKALSLIDATDEALRRRAAARDPRDGYGQSLDRAERRSLEEDRQLAVSTLGALQH